jgi:hypothetical protein
MIARGADVKQPGECGQDATYPEIRSWRTNAQTFSGLRVGNPTSAKLDFHKARGSRHIG